MKIIKAKINKKMNTCSFENSEQEYNEILNICSKCKYFDDETDFPNCFCEKSCEMIDFWFNTVQCPLNKFKVVEAKNNEIN